MGFFSLPVSIHSAVRNWLTRTGKLVADVREELTCRAACAAQGMFVFKAWKPNTCRDSCSWVEFEMMGEKTKQRVTQSPVLVSHVNVYH